MVQTIQEVEDRKASLEAVIATITVLLPTLTLGSDEYDLSAAKYLEARKELKSIPLALEAAKIAANKDAIDKVSLLFVETIQSLAVQSGIEALLLKPLTTVRYVQGMPNAEGVRSPAVVEFNPIFGAIAKVPKVKVEGASTEVSTGRKKVTGPNGYSNSPTKFVEAFSNGAEKLLLRVNGGKTYSHTVVDSQTKFDAFCVAHNLVGYSIS